MITRESDYALRIVDYLRHSDSKIPISVQFISEQVLVPYRFARKIIGQLANEGIIKTTRGKNGGVELNPEKQKISLFDIISVVDNKSLVLNRCLKEPQNCQRSAYCRVHKLFAEIQIEYEKLIKGIKL